MQPKQQKQINNILLEIAKEELGIETLENRNMDDLDFHDTHVACLRSALKKAFDAGRSYQFELK